MTGHSEKIGDTHSRKIGDTHSEKKIGDTHSEKIGDTHSEIIRDTHSAGIYLFWLLLAALVVILDQWSKALCSTHLDYGNPLTVFPGFDLLLVHNKGAAFSFLSDGGDLGRWLLVGISTVVSAGLLIWLWRLPREFSLLVFSLIFILGGAVGNLLDRFLMGYVVDFISVYYGQYRFATFNLADSAISLGAFLMALDVLVGTGKADAG